MINLTQAASGGEDQSRLTLLDQYHLLRSIIVTRQSSPLEIAVAAEIIDGANKRTGRAMIGHRKLAERLGVKDLRQIQRAVVAVLASGIIREVKKGRGSQPSAYAFRLPASDVNSDTVATTILPISDDDNGVKSYVSSCDVPTSAGRDERTASRQAGDKSPSALGLRVHNADLGDLDGLLAICRYQQDAAAVKRAYGLCMKNGADPAEIARQWEAYQETQARRNETPALREQYTAKLDAWLARNGWKQKNLVQSRETKSSPLTVADLVG